ncbi:MAG: uroporphyrinogen-III C-methyltransferase [Solirubrobacterales bacterium]
MKDAGGTAGAARAGTVYLVGGGPGDPGLLTVRAAELIASADAILYDRLIPDSVLLGARAGAFVEFAGKGPRGDSKLQPEIEGRMVELAQQGKSVVRLKGGDPLVFGRGGEEASTLAEAGIPFEIVPGVTAGVAAAAYAGVPVTHRDHAAAVAFVTGHEDPEKPESTIDWQALASFPGTLVFYMGVKNLPRISEQLIEAGRDASEHVAVIAQGTTPAQETVTGRLVDIAELVEEAQIKPPALTVIGSVVDERERIAWFEHRPLFGFTVAVTRARAQASKLSARLRELGAAVVEAPAISTAPRDDDEVRAATAAAGGTDLIAFTSANGVDAFFAALARDGRDARALPGVRFAAIGGATAEALNAHGIIADLVPERSAAEGLLELLADEDLTGKRILLAVAANARPVLGEGLRERGANVSEVAYYDTTAEPLGDDAKAAVAGADFITFASGSAVHSLVEALGGGEQLKQAQTVSIGPTTSAALREHGLEPTTEASKHDIDGLVEALLALA